MSVNNHQSIRSPAKRPTQDFLAYLPASWAPYAELMRLNKPVGIFIIYFPYLYGSLFAAWTTQPLSDPFSVLSTNLKLFPMAFLLRSAGCTWNDIIDRDLDRQVARCRMRPIARKAISLRNGYLFFAAQIFAWSGFVFQTEKIAIAYAVGAVCLAQIYPFSKRHTDYPQVVLGITLSWGTLVGCIFQGVHPIGLATHQPRAAAALACLCLSYVFWTVMYDTIYAFQDIQDDAKAGVRSMAVRFEHNPTVLLSCIAIGQIWSHVATAWFLNGGLWCYLALCGVPSVLLAAMTWGLDVRDADQCSWWFRYGSLMMGSTISVALLGEYVQRYSA